MMALLPMPHQLLAELCEELKLDTPHPVWGWTAAQDSDLAGYVVVALDGALCEILALEARDKEVADGLLRCALHALYRDGAQEYRFTSVPSLPLPSPYLMAGRGRLDQLFAPCGQNSHPKGE